MRRTRLAPSPTGTLHLGNARTFLINWLIARQGQWEISLRIEDLDGPRVRRGSDLQLINDMRYLGLDWDGQPIYQSSRVGHYKAVIEWLIERRLAYPCICSRSEVESAASAPHADDGSTRYPGTCRGRFSSIEEAQAASGRQPAIRFAAPDKMVEFQDEFQGDVRINVAKELGDFVIAKSDGTAAYQLAVVVDDMAGGITDVIRGADLLESAARQILIYEALGMESVIPRYTHLPLVVGQDGRRLAKRHGDTRISFYREIGVPASRILALLARWCGLLPKADYVENAANLLGRFDLRQLSKDPNVFTSEDDAFLRQGASCP